MASVSLPPKFAWNSWTPAQMGPIGGAMFLSVSRLETLNVPNIGPVQATMINAGNPTVFIEAAALGLRGTEL